MGTRVDPQSSTWTAEGLSTILFAPSKRIICKCKDNFTIRIPESLLCYFSRYYNALLRGHFSEAGSDSITLDLSAHQAKAFVTWMYSGQFAETCDYPMLFELYVFADQVDVPALKKNIMTFIHKRSDLRGSPAIGDAVKAFVALPKSCGLVRWLADRFAYHERSELLSDVNTEFINHVAAARSNIPSFVCYSTGSGAGTHPCCNVTVRIPCNCSLCQSRSMKKAQACTYHEHDSIADWRSKSLALTLSGLSQRLR